MPELPRTQRVAQSDKGPHYALINNTAPDWLKNADLERLHPLSELVLQRPTWYATATAQQHATLKALNGQAWAAQNTLDTKLRPVQDVYAFAEPLLKRAIKDQYALDLDVKTTYLRIYTPKKLPWYALELSNGVTSRDVSLLDAALHNFAGHETFERYSCYITRPDYRGHFSILHHERTMSLEQFKTLCRELDLGARYQQHLKQFLLPDEPVAQGYLQGLVTASQKATLKAAAQMALMNNDLQASAYAVVMGVLDGTEQRATFYQLSMLDTPLTGILLISTDLDRAASVAKVIAYIPNDPASPLKQYASSSEFVMDLSRRLQLNAPLPSSKHLPQHTYQQFFSQFVPHARRGLFFATLTEHL
ncbi:dermonecrotic toxin domain-containing protein [Pseudomonas sp. S3_E10]